MGSTEDVIALIIIGVICIMFFLWLVNGCVVDVTAMGQ